MDFDDDADTFPGTGDVSSELVEAVEWLKSQGYITAEERPFEGLLREAGAV
jgi:hypothetical protein